MFTFPAVNLFWGDAFRTEVGSGHIVWRIHKEKQAKDNQVDPDQDRYGVQRPA
jgi:hypothetical protein